MSSSLEFPVKNTRDAKLKAIWMQKVCTLVNTIVFFLLTTKTNHLLLFSGQVFLFIAHVRNDFIMWASFSTGTETLSVSTAMFQSRSSSDQQTVDNQRVVIRTRYFFCDSFSPASLGLRGIKLYHCMSARDEADMHLTNCHPNSCDSFTGNEENTQLEVSF